MTEAKKTGQVPADGDGDPVTRRPGAGGERAIGRTAVVSVVAMSCGLGLNRTDGAKPPPGRSGVR
jgi:hypothetical protein